MAKIATPKISIAGVDWLYWSWVEFEESLDEPWRLSFGGPWDPNSQLQRATYVPGSFKDVGLKIDDQLVFSGQMIDAVTEGDDSSATISVPCYAHCGALSDITAPDGFAPIEFNGAKIDTVVSKICGAVGVPFKITGPVGAAFEKLKLEPSDKLWDFLAEAAKLRDLLLGSTDRGELLVHVAPQGSIVERFTQGDAPGFSIARQGDMQQLCTEVTPMAKARKGRAAAKETIKVALGPKGRIRPHCFSADLASDEPDHAARGELARIFGGILEYTLTVPSWFASSGARWAAGQKVEVHYPIAQIYQPYQFTIRKIKFVHEDDPDNDPTQHAELSLVLPGIYSNSPPERWPWS